jgi:hypothetical protein
VFALLSLVGLSASVPAVASTSSDWKFIEVVFNGRGEGHYTYAPGLVGKSQDYFVTWTMRFRAGRDYRWIIERVNIGGNMDAKSNVPGGSCSGAIAPAPNIVPPKVKKKGAPQLNAGQLMVTTGGKGYKTLLGAQVPLFQQVVYVPTCAQTLGAGLAAGIGYAARKYTADYWKHQFNVAEFALDLVNPRSQILKYPLRTWTTPDVPAAKVSISWNGEVEILVNGRR